MDYQILNTEAETQYDNLVLLAAYICKTSIALITFIDKDRQWIKAKAGLVLMKLPRKKLSATTLSTATFFLKLKMYVNSSVLPVSQG